MTVHEDKIVILTSFVVICTISTCLCYCHQDVGQWKCSTSIRDEASHWNESNASAGLWQSFPTKFGEQLLCRNISITHFMVLDTSIAAMFASSVPSNGSRQQLTEILYYTQLYETIPGMYCLNDLLEAGTLNTVLGIQTGKQLPLSFLQWKNGSVEVIAESSRARVVGAHFVCNNVVYLLAQPLLLPQTFDFNMTADNLDLPMMTKNRFLPPVPDCPGNAGHLPTSTTNYEGATSQAPPAVPSPPTSSSSGSSFPVVAVVLPVVLGSAVVLSAAVAIIIVRRIRRKRRHQEAGDKARDTEDGSASKPDPIAGSDDKCISESASGPIQQSASHSGTNSGQSSFHAPVISVQSSGKREGPQTLSLADSARSEELMGAQMSAREGGRDARTLLRNLSSISDSYSIVDEIEIRPEELVLVEGDNGPVKLGSGGFGVVYQGVRNGVQLVAIKVTTTHSKAIQRNKHQLLKEISHLRACRDPNIVQFLGVCFHGDGVMMVTEYMPGGDLMAALTGANKQEYMWNERGCELAVDIVKGLCYLHGRNMVHCDVKPHNILLDGSGMAKLSDLGMSNVMLSKGYITQVSDIGTFAWAAPEMILNQKVTAAVDMYSFGIVLWQIITGMVPMRGRVDIESLAGLCPEAIIGLVDACLSVQPEQRPTAKHAYDVLLNALMLRSTLFH